ncbi:MAG TPA: BON domain-containing protein [Polyangiaceae bacterium]|nr:BON domain-containing protein [Polyangiaceae bacterium]
MTKLVVLVGLATSVAGCASTPPPRVPLPGDATAVEPRAELPQRVGEVDTSPRTEMNAIPSPEPTVNAGDAAGLAGVRVPHMATPPAPPPSQTGMRTDPDNRPVVDHEAAPGRPAVSADPDLNLAERVRNALVADESLSYAAKTVRVLVAEGKVTLRGAVENEREWKVVGEHAQRVAGADRVDNQLKVRPRPRVGR